MIKRIRKQQQAGDADPPPPEAEEDPKNPEKRRGTSATFSFFTVSAESWLVIEAERFPIPKKLAIRVLSDFSRFKGLLSSFSDSVVDETSGFDTAGFVPLVLLGSLGAPMIGFMKMLFLEPERTCCCDVVLVGGIGAGVSGAIDDGPGVATLAIGF